MHADVHVQAHGWSSCGVIPTGGKRGEAGWASKTGILCLVACGYFSTLEYTMLFVTALAVDFHISGEEQG